MQLIESIRREGLSMEDAINLIFRERIKPNSLVYHAIFEKRWESKTALALWKSIPISIFTNELFNKAVLLALESELEDALAILCNAINQNLANTACYTFFIDAAEKKQYFKGIRIAFLKARHKKLRDPDIFNSIIYACRKNKVYVDADGYPVSSFKLATEAFEYLNSEKIANLKTHNLFLDLLILQSNRLEECKKIFNDAKFPIVQTKENESTWIDTTILSCGATKTLFHILIEEEKAGPFGIICGRSSLEDQNDRKFKEELQDYIKSTWPNAKVTDDEKTLERFVVHIE